MLFIIIIVCFIDLVFCMHQYAVVTAVHVTVPPTKTVSVTLGLLYYTLGNIEPKLRSKLQSIQLLCIVKDVYVQQYGIDAILAPFVEEIKLLEDVSDKNKAIAINYI